MSVNKNKWTSSMGEPNPKHFKEYVKDEELAKLIEGKRIAFVGPGAHLNGTNSGELIDSYDVVIRAAQIFPIPEVDHKDRGLRTNIVIHSFNQNQIPECKKNIEFFKSLDYVICSMVSSSFKVQHDKFFDYFRSQGISVHKPEDGYLLKIFSEVGTCLNSGISGLISILNYDVKEIYITGFNFYNMGKYGQVYSDSFFNVAKKNKVFGGGDQNNQMTAKSGRHDLHNQEAQIRHLRKLAEEHSDIIKLDKYLQENLWKE